MTNLNKRHEIIFLYDVKDANPNGDPDDSNRPRTDHLGYNIVTDVRLKRTVRDYWLQHYQNKSGMDVLVKRSENVEDGTVKSMAQLITDALDLPEKIEKKAAGKIVQSIRKDVPATFMDVRFFGGAITLKGANVSITGPVQFAIGRSLNRPRINTHTITTTFSSGEGKAAGTFGETHTVDYSLIAFGGVISETTAIDTDLKPDELKYLWEGLWKGTKNLNTRSKFNHVPRLMISIMSMEGEFQIGGMYRRLELDLDSAEERINSENDVIINLDKFINRLNLHKDAVEKIFVKEDDLMNYIYQNTNVTSLKALLKDQGFTVDEFPL